MFKELLSIVWRSLAIALFASGFLSAYSLVSGGFWSIFWIIFFGSVTLGAVTLSIGKVGSRVKTLSQYVFAALAYILAVLAVLYALDAPLIIRPAGEGFHGRFISPMTRVLRELPFQA